MDEGEERYMASLRRPWFRGEIIPGADPERTAPDVGRRPRYSREKLRDSAVSTNGALSPYRGHDWMKENVEGRIERRPARLSLGAVYVRGLVWGFGFGCGVVAAVGLAVAMVLVLIQNMSGGE